MTPVQQEAMQRIRQLLNEHFDAWVLATRDIDEHTLASINSFWGGPQDSVNGLVHITRVRLDKIILDTTGPAEPFTKLPT